MSLVSDSSTLWHDSSNKLALNKYDGVNGVGRDSESTHVSHATAGSISFDACCSTEERNDVCNLKQRTLWMGFLTLKILPY